MRISFSEAQKRITERISPLPPTFKPVENAVGFIAAEDISATMNQPPFPRSPYDGYALRAADSAGAREDSPIELTVIGESFAGSPASVTVSKGEAVRIMTGGAVPEGADCVIPQEKTDEGDVLVRIFSSLKPYENYCEAGGDFKAGERLFPAGTRITAAASAVASSTGITQISVFSRPHIAIISTGDELAAPSHSLLPGQIYASNNTYLSSRLTELGVAYSDFGNVRDDADHIASSIKSGVNNAQLIVITGGVSVGKKDLVMQALSSLEADIVFHGIDMKPGMPAAFAVLNGTPIFALSGNPFAAAVDFELLVRPAISLMASDERMGPKVRRARITSDFTKQRPVCRFVRAMLANESVAIPSEQSNGHLRAMIGCNCIAELPMGDEPLPRGSTVNVYTLENRYYE